MSNTAYARRPRRWPSPLPALACLTALTAVGWTVLYRPHGQDLRAASPAEEAQASVPPPARKPRADLAFIFDPAPVLGAATAGGFARDLPALAFNTAAPPALRPSLVAEISAPPAAVSPTPAAAPTLAVPAPPRRVASAEPTLVPLPVRRPASLSDAAGSAAPASVAHLRMASRRALPATRDVFRAAIAEEPSFLDRLFGGGSSDAPAQGAGQALAYANPDAVATPRPRLGPASSASPSEGVAVYDISAGTVTLPSGEVLEAHSGYGDLMDDPRYVHVRMRGATPPGTYDMTERGALFHGVRAIRLTPVGGSAAIHGRDGILAHTYMLRAQPGASNGCVVFRDYDRFLRAFLRGEVRRLVVVAGNRSARMNLASRGGR